MQLLIADNTASIQITTGNEIEGDIFKILPHPANFNELRPTLASPPVFSLLLLPNPLGLECPEKDH